MLENVRSVLTKKLGKYKDSSAITFLSNTVNNLGKIADAIDKVLIKNGWDIGAAATRIKGRATTAKNVGTELVDMAKKSSIGTKVIEKKNNLISGIKNFLGKSDNTDTGPPNEENIISKTKGLLGSLFSSKPKEGEATDEAVQHANEKEAEAKIEPKNKYRKYNKTAGIIENGIVGGGKLVAGASSGIAKGISDVIAGTGKVAIKGLLATLFGSKPKETTDDKIKDDIDRTNKDMEKADTRDAKHKAEVEDEKKNALGKKAKGGDGWLGKILGGLSSLGGMLLTGFTKSIGFLGGFLLKGLGKVFTSIVPSLATTIAKMTAGGVGGLLKGAGSLAWGAAKIAGRVALGAVASPIGLVIAAATVAYLGYKLYKYYTRGSFSNDDAGQLTRYRLMLYGLNESKKDLYGKIFDLEMYLKDHIVFENNKADLSKLDKEAKEEIYKIFGLVSTAPNFEFRSKILQLWLNNRFFPAFLGYITALKQVKPDIYIDDLDKLKSEEMSDFLSRINVTPDIYSITQLPYFNNPDITVTQDEIEKLKESLLNKVKSKSSANPLSTDNKYIAYGADGKRKTSLVEDNKTTSNAANPSGQSKAALAFEASSKAASEARDKVKSDVPINTEDGEKKPAETTSDTNLTTKVSEKNNIAKGNLTPGGSLSGIKLNKISEEKIYNLDPNVKELFTGMSKEYNALTNKEIPVNEAARSFEDQSKLYNANPKLAAKPGNSTHEFGLALDISSKTADELDDLGLLGKYGFTRPIGGEKWHLENVGTSINPDAAKHDPNYRLNSILASVGKGGGGYGALDESIPKRRDINYQKQLANEDGNIIDEKELTEKALKATDKKIATTVTTVDTSNKLQKAPEATNLKISTPSVTSNSKSTVEANIQKLNNPVLSKEADSPKPSFNFSSKPKDTSTINTAANTPAVFNTENMESILSNQLKELTNVSAILSIISDKIDIEKLANLINQKPQAIAQAQSRQNTMSNSAVSVKRNNSTV